MIQTFKSEAKVTQEIINELVTKAKEVKDAKLGLLFCSSTLDYEAINKGVYDALGISILGCTSHMEILNGKLKENSTLLTVFDGATVEKVYSKAITGDIKGKFKEYIEEAGNQLGVDLNDYNVAGTNKYAGIIFTDFLKHQDEDVIEEVGTYAAIPYVGGTASDNVQFKKTCVFLDGKTYEGVVVITTIKFAEEVKSVKSQSFKSMGKTMTATKVSDDGRTVYEFNDRPAAEVYAELLGVAVEDLQPQFFGHPVGVIVEDEIFVRSAAAINPDKSILFASRLYQYADVDILETVGIIEDTTRVVQELIAQGFNTLFLTNCAYRTLETVMSNKVAEHEKAYEGIDVFGFSCYGEFNTCHVNHSASILALK